MRLLSSRDPWYPAQAEAALSALGIAAEWVPLPPPGPAAALDLEVAAAHQEAAQALLTALYAEDLAAHLTAAAAAARARPPPLLLLPPVATAVGAAGALLAFYARTGDLLAGGPWQARGALVPAAVLAGERWRLVTAATLHADNVHATGNAAFWVVLGWAAGERLGSGVALWVWLCAAVVGFGGSLLGDGEAVVVGASGGLFGMLGGAVGHALRHLEADVVPAKRRLQVTAAAILLLALTAFSPHADWPAHLGGFVAGTLLGAQAPRRPLPAWAQLCCGLGSAAALVAAWACAWARLP